MLNARLRQHGPWFGVLLALVAGFVLAAGGLVYARTRVTSMRYELGRRIAREQALLDEVERLRVEVAALAAPDRLEPRAKRLGLIYPTPEQVVALPRSEPAQIAAGGQP